MSAFNIKVSGRLLDYRLGHARDIESFSKLLLAKNYEVENLRMEVRHVVGIIRKQGKLFFVKLATSEGMSYLTQNEFEWNRQFNELNPRENSNFWVPLNSDSGYFSAKDRSSSGGINLFYMIISFQEGEKLAKRPNPGYEISDFSRYLDRVIDFTELIQSLDFSDLNPDGDQKFENHHQRFIEKTKLWLENTPKDIVKKYDLNQLLDIVINGTTKLNSKPRHGDFTPWHIFKLKDDKLFLFDGERALSEGVEYYDIAYYIQRVFSVLENRNVAEEILSKLRQRSYNFSKLQTVLAARAIGGFLDRSFHEKPNYRLDQEFKELVLNL